MATISHQLRRAVPGVKIRPVPNKLLCILGRSTVKIEVNGIKRGIIGPTIEMPLCDKAKAEFGIYCKARIVPLEQLYGGKIAAALSRQHPRDLFDYNYMDTDNIERLKRGFMFALLGSNKPFIKYLSPNLINQQDALENQFRGMTDIPFTYENYENARTQLYNLRFFFCISAFINFNTASKSSGKKFDTSPVGTTRSICLCRGMICLHTPVFLLL